MEKNYLIDKLLDIVILQEMSLKSYFNEVKKSRFDYKNSKNPSDTPSIKYT